MKVIRKVIAQFERENPDIHVHLINIADYNLYHQKMMVLYAGNAAPDVAMMDPAHFQALATRGALLPLNQFFGDIPGFDIHNYYPRIVDGLSLNGSLYVLPRDIAPENIVYYNKKMFDEAGIPYPDGSWTWDYQERPELKEKDFLWVMHQLTKKEASGKVDRFGLTPANPQLFMSTLGYTSGQRYVDDAKNPTKVLTGDKGWLDACNLMWELQTSKHWMPSQTDVSSVLQSAAFQIFIDGKTAMFQSGIWEVPQIRKYMSPGTKGFFDYDIVPFPKFADMPANGGIASGGSGYAIFNTTPHPKEAWRLASYMAGPVGMRAMAIAGIAQPALRNVALTDVWLPGPNTALAEQYPHNRIMTDAGAAQVVWDPTSELWPDAGSILQSKLDGFYNGITPPKDLLPEATKETQDRLDYLNQQRTMPKFSWPAGIAVGILIAAGIVTWVYLPERGKKYTNRMKRENKSAYLFLTPWLIGLICLTIGPMILSLLMSTTDWDMIRPAQWRGLGNYTEAATIDPRFWVSLRVTLIYTAVRVPLGLFFAFLLALLLNQKVKGVSLFRTFYYIPSLVSAVAASLVWRKMFSPDGGFINSIIYSPFIEKTFHIGSALSTFAGTPGSPVNWLGNERTALLSFIMISVWGVGGSMVILLAGLQGIPDYYYEAATMDGASAWNKMRAITVPLLTPALFFTLITGVISSFQAFTEVFTITTSAGGPNNATMLYMLNLYKAGFESYRFGYVAALAWVLFFIIMAFTLFQMKMNNRWVYYESDVK